MQAHEQLGARVEEPPAQVGDAAAREERAKRERVVEVARDQGALEVLASFGDDTDRVDDRHPGRCEPAQEPVLAARDRLRELLDGVDRRSQRVLVLDEAHDVPVDPAHDLDEPLRLPLGEWVVPRQVEEGRVSGARDQLQPGGAHSRSIVASADAAIPPGLRVIALRPSSASAPKCEWIATPCRIGSPESPSGATSDTELSSISQCE